MSASAFSLTLAVPASGFAVIFGVPVSGGLKGTTRHFFCPTCKSWVYTQLEGIDDYVNVRSTLLDRHGWFVPFIETWTQHKLPWARTPAQHRFATQPDPAAFKQLAQVFAKRGARPRPVGSSGFAFW